MNSLFPLLAAFAASLLLCGFAHRIRCAKQISQFGGVALLIAWWVTAYMFGALEGVPILGFAIATGIVIIFGVIDVVRPLSPMVQLAGQVAAAVSVVAGGVTVLFITHPFADNVALRLDAWELWGFAIPGALLVLVWIVTLMNAVNFLDGMDGLAGGVSAIAFIAVGFVSLLPEVGDERTALAAFLAAAVLAGFLFWNLPPAGLYLGTVGPWFLGLLLAILSVQGASKVATAAVVGAVPLLDAASVILGRIWRGHSPFRGDLTHLHHRLLRRGFSERSILLLYYAVSLTLGASAVLLQTRYKVTVFLFVSMLFVLFIAIGSRVVRRKRREVDPLTGQ